uniref:Uncharacterized protein n=1 Tax=Caenorhabditis japonica TaxID=281687 RepID=A0A8R1EMN8_CAEJA
MDFLNTSFKNLEPSVTILGSWLKSSKNKATKVQLDVLRTLFSPRKAVSSRNKVLIGLPNKSKDLEMLEKDFENNWLKDMLNKGSSLDELKVALLPVRNISSNLASVEEGWTNPKKILYFEIAQQSLRTIRNVCKRNPTSLLQSFSQVKNEYTQLMLANNFDASDADNFKNLLNSPIALNDVKNDLSFLNNSIFTEFNSSEIVLFHSSFPLLNETAKVEHIRNSPLIKKYHQMFDSANGKMQELENKFDSFRYFLSDVLKFKPFLNAVINVSTSIDSIIKTVENYVNVLWGYSRNGKKWQKTARKLEKCSD